MSRVAPKRGSTVACPRRDSTSHVAQHSADIHRDCRIVMERRLLAPEFLLVTPNPICFSYSLPGASSPLSITDSASSF
jgi:hypothetical protein